MSMSRVLEEFVKVCRPLSIEGETLSPEMKQLVDSWTKVLGDETAARIAAGVLSDKVEEVRERTENWKHLTTLTLEL
jgi:hypothetical protein